MRETPQAAGFPKVHQQPRRLSFLPHNVAGAAREGFLPPTALKCFDSSKSSRGGQAGCKPKAITRGRQGCLQISLEPNAFACGPDKITGPLSRQRSDFPRNPALALLASRGHTADQALKPDSIPGMRTHPPVIGPGPFQSDRPKFPLSLPASE